MPTHCPVKFVTVVSTDINYFELFIEGPSNPTAIICFI